MTRSTEQTLPNQGFRGLARRFWSLLCRPFAKSAEKPPQQEKSPRQEKPELQPLTKVILTEGVSETLFSEFAEHRETERGKEEIGWLLIGYRDRDCGIVHATLPAGTGRDAGVAHVNFDSQSQTVGNLILRQQDKRLTVLGVVHTHPGNLRRPSQQDYKGDRDWVKKLIGGEGIFGIGTADGKSPASIASDGEVCLQCRGDLLFSWYALGTDEANYRDLPVEVVPGADQARKLRPVQAVLEEHAERLIRLFQQQTKVESRIIEHGGKALSVTFPLTMEKTSVVVLLRPGEIEYYVNWSGETFRVDPDASYLDEGVYLLLAELARRS